MFTYHIRVNVRWYLFFYLIFDKPDVVIGSYKEEVLEDKGNF